MGINTDRFADDVHENFLCPICLDVVLDPIVLNECDHFYCKDCFSLGIENQSNPTCSKCRIAIDKNAVKTGFVRQVNAIYTSLRIKCLEPSCTERLNIESYQLHEYNCPKTTFTCLEECGFTSMGPDGIHAHNCIQWLKQQVESAENTALDAVQCKEAIESTLNEILDALTTAQEEKERAEIQVAQLREEFEKFQNHKRVRCGLIIPSEMTFYRCKSCAVDVPGALCESCYETGHHSGHEADTYVSRGDGTFCVCGDGASLIENSRFCSHHDHEHHEL